MCVLVVSNGDDPEIVGTSPHKDRAVALIHATDFAEARHAVATEHVDAVLIDFNLARTSGRDIRRQLAPSSLRVPVIVLLEDDAVVLVDEAIAFGVDGFYYKSQLYPWLFGAQEEAHPR